MQELKNKVRSTLFFNDIKIPINTIILYKYLNVGFWCFVVRLLNWSRFRLVEDRSSRPRPLGRIQGPKQRLSFPIDPIRWFCRLRQIQLGQVQLLEHRLRRLKNNMVKYLLVHQIKFVISLIFYPKTKFGFSLIFAPKYNLASH